MGIYRLLKSMDDSEKDLRSSSFAAHAKEEMGRVMEILEQKRLMIQESVTESEEKVERQIEDMNDRLSLIKAKYKAQKSKAADKLDDVKEKYKKRLNQLKAKMEAHEKARQQEIKMALAVERKKADDLRYLREEFATLEVDRAEETFKQMRKRLNVCHQNFQSLQDAAQKIVDDFDDRTTELKRKCGQRIQELVDRKAKIFARTTSVADEILGDSTKDESRLLSRFSKMIETCNENLQKSRVDREKRHKALKDKIAQVIEKLNGVCASCVLEKNDESEAELVPNEDASEDKNEG